MATGRKTGGRQKGTPNKVTTEQREKIAASKMGPIEYMQKVLNDTESTDADRKWAAATLAPYVSPRLQAVQHAGSIDSTVTHEQALEQLRKPGERDAVADNLKQRSVH